MQAQGIVLLDRRERSFRAALEGLNRDFGPITFRADVREIGRPSGT